MIDRQTLLVVDDMSRFNGSDLFNSDCDIEVLRVNDRQAAQTLLKKPNRIGAILINLEQSAEESLTLIEDIRNDCRFSQTAVGFCADAPDHASIARAMACKTDEIILRPFHPVLLSHQLQKLMKAPSLKVPCCGEEKGIRFSKLVDALQTGVGIFEYTGSRLSALYVNSIIDKKAHFTPDESARFREDAFTIMQPLGVERILQVIANPEKDATTIDIPLKLTHHEGAEFMVRIHILPISCGGCAKPTFLVNMIDITHQRSIEKELTEKNRKLETLLKLAPGGVAVFDFSKDVPTILYANDELCKMLGLSVEECNRLMMEDVLQRVDLRDREPLAELMRAYKEHPRHSEVCFRLIDSIGDMRWIHMFAVPFSDTNLCSVTLIDITHDKEAELILDSKDGEPAYRSEYDALTGINNRESFYRRTAELLQANRDQQYVILVMDIDRFKAINELFGKEVGDSILVAIARGLRQQLKDIGTFARMEADHFAVCFPQQLLDMERIIRLFERGFKRQKLDYNLQMSFGVYPVQSVELPVMHMCDRAFMALKTIKGNVMKRYAFYDDQLRQSLLEESEILDEMNAALEQGQFIPYLQPIFAVDQQMPESAEVLVRWNHPQKGIIPPAKFIPLFEKNGFITRLDFYIWEQACVLLARWKKEGVSIPLSVNMSRNDFYHPYLCEQLLCLTERYGIHPSQLRLEITESAYSKDPDELARTIEQLRSHGFSILMDDFGSGYSSLNVLMDMPVDILKLDMHFLSQLDSNPRAASVLTSVVRMAKWLRMPIVAEGVSTREQLAFLRSVGCDHVQGFLFAQPMSVQDFDVWYVRLEESTLKDVSPAKGVQVDLSSPWDLDAITSSFFNGMIGGIGIYELCGDELEIRRVNDGYYELMGCTPKQVFDSVKDALFSVYPEDRYLLLQACRKATLSGNVERIVCRHIQRRNGAQIWLEVRLRFLGKAGINDVFCFAYDDYTEQKEFEQTRAMRNYAILLRSVYVQVYEINLTLERYRSVYIADAQADETQERPLEELKRILRDMLVKQDDELEEQVFQKGYLQQKLRGNRCDYYLTERQIRMNKGQTRWVSFTLIRIPSEMDDESYMLCIADVDKRKAADALLQENHWLTLRQKELDRYQSLMERLGTTLLEWDLKTGSFVASAGFQKFAVSSYDFHQMTTYKDLEIYFYQKDLDTFRRFVNDLLAHGNASVTLRVLDRENQPCWCRLLSSLYMDENGHMARCVAAVQQIDDQMKIRETYQEEQKRFHTFADNFNIGLGIFEMQGEEQRVLYLNDGYRKMVGYAEGDAYYNPSTPFACVIPEDIPRFLEANRELMRTQKPYIIEYRVKHKNGRLLWMRSVNAIYPGSDSDKLRIFAVIEDITEMKSLRNWMDRICRQIPFAMGLYDITDQNDVKTVFENPIMQTLKTGGKTSREQADAGSIMTGDGVKQYMVSQYQQGSTEGDENVTLQLPYGKTSCVRLLYTTYTMAGRTNCYCALIGTAPTAPDRNRNKPVKG